MKNNQQHEKLTGRQLAIRVTCGILAALFVISSFTIALTFILQSCSAGV